MDAFEIERGPETLSTAFRLVVIAIGAALAIELIRWEAPVTAVAAGAAVVTATVWLLGWALKEAYAERARIAGAVMALGLLPVFARSVWPATWGWSEAGAAVACTALGFAIAFGLAGRVALAWLPRATAGVALVAAAALVAALPAASGPQLALLASLPSGSSSTGFDQVLPIGDGSFALGRSCIGGSCFAYVRHDAEVRSLGPRFARDAELSLWHDAASQQLVVSAGSEPIALAVEDLGDWRAPLGTAVAPTPGSMALCAAALLGAAVWLLRRRALRARLAAVPVLVSGELDEGGWLHVDGATPPLRLGSASLGEPGPVVLLDDPGAARGTVYRAAARGEPRRLYHGDRDALTSELTRALALTDACALSWIAVLAAPLSAALAMRLW